MTGDDGAMATSFKVAADLSLDSSRRLVAAVAWTLDVRAADTHSPDTLAPQVPVAVPMTRFIVGRDSVRVEVRRVLR